MRDIIFRGKRVDNGEWVYGGIVHQTDYYGDNVDKWFIIDGTDTQDYDIGYEYRVIAETVGQYTGLTDKNGKRIFEGDIFIVSGVPKYRYIVEWEECGFEVFIDPAGFDANDIEIVGNIQDNPELIEATHEP